MERNLTIVNGRLVKRGRSHRKSFRPEHPGLPLKRNRISDLIRHNFENKKGVVSDLAARCVEAVAFPPEPGKQSPAGGRIEPFTQTDSETTYFDIDSGISRTRNGCWRSQLHQL